MSDVPGLPSGYKLIPGSYAIANQKGQTYYTGAVPPQAFHAEMDPAFIMRLAFLETVRRRTDTLSTALQLGIEHSGLGFLDAVAQCASLATGGSEAEIVGLVQMHHMIVVPHRLQVHVYLSKDLTETASSHYRIEIAGERGDVLELRRLLQEQFGDGKLATVSWWYEARGGSQVRSFVMGPTKPIRDEFYPFLGRPVEQFIDDYLSHSASILFLMGEPGTGKTSLVRHMLYTRRLNATMTYDEALLGRDEVFVNFLMGEEDGVLIIEDADTMLGSRESEQNKLISRFLNVSDGLVKLNGKKIVFTTNLGDFKKVDGALIRPGRCFGAVKFRPLDQVEANAAAKAAGLSAPTGRPEYTLADLFNGANTAPALVSIGF